MKIDLSKVKFSRNDIKRGLKLPSKLTPELAEDVGFHIGDGYMKNRKGKDFNKYEFAYSGDRGLDSNYFNEILIPRKRELFNLVSVELKNSNKSNELFLRFQSKALFLFYRDVLGVQESPKKNIDVPKWIFTSLDFKLSFLRGLMDSDGNFRSVKKNYPVIHFQFQGDKLIKSIEIILKNIGIYFCSYKHKELDKRTNKIYRKYCIQISGRENLNKWMKYIGFKNIKHIKKYEKWVWQDLNLRTPPLLA